MKQSGHLNPSEETGTGFPVTSKYGRTPPNKNGGVGIQQQRGRMRGEGKEKERRERGQRERGRMKGVGNEGRRGGEGGKEKEVSEMEELGREACIIYIIRRIALVSHLDLSCCC